MLRKWRLVSNGFVRPIDRAFVFTDLPDSLMTAAPSPSCYRHLPPLFFSSDPCHIAEPRQIRTQLQKKESVPKQSLPQLYRFCFLMVGDAGKAAEVFQATMHEAALRAAQGEQPKDRFWLFREARGRCLEASESGIQPEEVEMEEHDIAAWGPKQIAQLEPSQLAIWISGAPEPQRSTLAFFYLDYFSHEDLLGLLEQKPAEFSKHIANGRLQFQAWLDAAFPHHQE